nr:immunoglobulin heavy chain junction region [Macaca mulatta]MOX68183.1 immunoglobulin heavy chain junction region [Macaca mulatta]
CARMPLNSGSYYFPGYVDYW